MSDGVTSRLHEASSEAALAYFLGFEEQKEFLRLEGCDAMQGFLFSGPLPVDQLTALLRAHLDRDRSEES